MNKKEFEDRICYYNDAGELHREDGPAIEYVDGTKIWFKNDLRHREDGPAVEYENGSVDHCLNDILFYKDEFDALIAIKKKKPAVTIDFSDSDVANNKKWLNLLRKKATINFPNGESGEMVVDMVERNCMDAVGIVPYYYSEGSYSKPYGGIRIFLRSCIRPSVYYRHGSEGIMWEIPAGVIDPGEKPKDTARRELMEEMGFDVALSDMNQLGNYFYSSVGIMGEKIYLYDAEVDPLKREVPTEDGSVLEKFGEIIDVSLKEAFLMVDAGEIVDSKTIIALERVRNIW